MFHMLQKYIFTMMERYRISCLVRFMKRTSIVRNSTSECFKILENVPNKHLRTLSMLRRTFVRWFSNDSEKEYVYEDRQPGSQRDQNDIQNFVLHGISSKSEKTYWCSSEHFNAVESYINLPAVFWTKAVLKNNLATDYQQELAAAAGHRSKLFVDINLIFPTPLHDSATILYRSN